MTNSYGLIAKTGEICPAAGNWRAVGCVKSDTQIYAYQQMPDFNGVPVIWIRA